MVSTRTHLGLVTFAALAAFTVANDVPAPAPAADTCDLPAATKCGENFGVVEAAHPGDPDQICVALETYETCVSEMATRCADNAGYATVEAGMQEKRTDMCAADALCVNNAALCTGNPAPAPAANPAPAPAAPTAAPTAAPAGGPAAPPAGTTTTTMTAWDSSSGSSGGESSNSLYSASLAEDSSSTFWGPSSVSSSGSGMSGSGGSYMNIWLWVLLVVCLCICKGGAIAALLGGKKPKKKPTKKKAAQAKPAPVPVADEEEALLPPLVPLATSSAFVPSYSMIAPQVAYPATTAYAAPATTAYAAPATTAYAGYPATTGYPAYSTGGVI